MHQFEFTRLIEAKVQHHLKRGKSILLLGPRQTGKTTLLEKVPHHLSISLLLSRERLKFEKDPSLLGKEIESLKNKSKIKLPLVIIDEIQKVPALMDEVQYLIDKKSAQFILTGSSARKLKMHTDVNLLPGRVVLLRMDPISIFEFPKLNILQAINDGSLPAVYLEETAANRQDDLQSYIETYLEDEIRKEAVVRNLAHFARFLELACLESGKLISFRAISQELGIAHTTVSAYYQILEDCLIAEKIEPITRSLTRKKLIKACRYYIFDGGVRRLGANEPANPEPTRIGEWFEQWVGLELIRGSRLGAEKYEVKFWTDPNGPEVDFVIQKNGNWIPLEVKWSQKPNTSDAKNLEIFLNEYPECKTSAYIVCRCDRRFQVSSRVVAIPWQELPSVLKPLE